MVFAIVLNDWSRMVCVWDLGWFALGDLGGFALGSRGVCLYGLWRVWYDMLIKLSGKKRHREHRAHRRCSLAHRQYMGQRRERRELLVVVYINIY